MAVFRLKKNENFATMSSIYLQNKKLSFKVKGMLSVFLSLSRNGTIQSKVLLRFLRKA